MISYLKAGLALADRIYGVASYAAEIRTPELGMGFDGCCAIAPPCCRASSTASTRRSGTPPDPHLVAASTCAIARPRRNRRRCRRLGLDAAPEVPLFGVVSRLTWQKAWTSSPPRCLRSSPVVVRAARQQRRLRADFAGAAHTYPGRVAAVIGYDEPRPLMQGGVDALLVPSRFEPAASQLCALRYGAIPSSRTSVGSPTRSTPTK
jgi:starch synthase